MQASVQGSTALSFESTTFDVVTRDGQPWLRLQQIAVALGYSRPDVLQQLHTSNAAEFTDTMTILVRLPTAGGPQWVRLFSLRGAHLLGMFARTPKAATFRKWVLDVLERSAAPAPAWAANTPAGLIRPKINRTIERLALELFVAGLSLRTIGLQLGISKGAASQIINGVWRFAPNSGPCETTPALLQQVAQRHEAIEQERIVQKFCSSAANQELSAVLDATGRRMVAALAGQQP